MIRVRKRCVEGCSSGSSMHQDEGGFGNEGVYAMTTYNRHSAMSGEYLIFLLMKFY